MSETRLNNKFLLRTLEICSRHLDRSAYRQVHEFVRRFQVRYLAPWLFKKLKAKNSQLINVEIRHSSRSPGDYHVLLSDIDVSLVVKNSASLAEIRELFAAYASVRKLWIFLGECEIYHEDEFDRKRAIEMRLDEVVTALRNLRKIDWIKRDERPYHRVKYERSLRKITQHLERLQNPTYVQSLIKMTSGFVPTELPSDQHALNCDSYIGSGVSQLHGVLKCWIYSILPVQTFEVPVATQATPIRIDLLQHERIQCLAGSRVLTDQNVKDRYEAWIQILDQEIAKAQMALRAS